MANGIDVMEQGRIVGEDAHQQLPEQNEQYAPFDGTYAEYPQDLAMHQDALEVLLLCLGVSDAAAVREELARVSSDEWCAILAEAQKHKLMPLLYRQLKQLGAALPDPVAHQLRQSYRDNALRNLRLKEQLGELERAFQARGIPIIVLKGMHLAEAIYGNLALRTMLDIDLVAREEDLPRFDKVLLEQGYRPHDQIRVVGPDNHHFHYTVPETGGAVEIHWALIPSCLPVRIDTEGLWARARPAQSAYAAALVLSFAIR